MTPAPPIILGSPSGEHLTLEVHRRERPDDHDRWDGNWLVTSIRLRVGAFHGAFEASLLADELASFRDELQRLHATLTGKATFTSMEEWLSIELEGNVRGVFVARCEARDGAGVGNTLHFTLGLDQTDLGPILRAMNEVLRAFPVRGMSSPSGT